MSQVAVVATSGSYRLRKKWIYLNYPRFSGISCFKDIIVSVLILNFLTCHSCKKVKWMMTDFQLAAKFVLELCMQARRVNIQPSVPMHIFNLLKNLSRKIFQCLNDEKKLVYWQTDLKSGLKYVIKLKPVDPLTHKWSWFHEVVPWVSVACAVCVCACVCVYGVPSVSK